MNKILDNDYYDFIISNTLIPSNDFSENVTKLNSDYSLLHLAKKICRPAI